MPPIFYTDAVWSPHRDERLSEPAFELEGALQNLLPAQEWWGSPYTICVRKIVVVGEETVVGLEVEIDVAWRGISRPLADVVADVAVVAEDCDLKLESTFVRGSAIVMILRLPAGWQELPRFQPRD